MKTGKGGLYFQNFLAFTILVSVAFGLLFLGPIKDLRAFSAKQTGLDWVWPLTLFLAVVGGSFLLRVGKEAESGTKLVIRGILFIVAYELFHRGLPKIRVGLGDIDWILHGFLTGMLIEFLFRRIGFESLRKQEEKFHSDPLLKRIGPFSFLVTCMIYALLHGFQPVLASGGAFSQPAYAQAFQASALLTFFYVATRSVWVPATGHFLQNIAALVW